MVDHAPVPSVEVDISSFDKDIEVQSLHSSSSSSHSHRGHDSIHSNHDREKGLELGPRRKKLERRKSMTEKGDIEAYPDAVNDPQNEEYSGGDVAREEGEGNGKGNGKGLGSNLKSVLTRISTRASMKDPGPPPDGGWSGWTQAALGHLVIMNTWGFINSFGVFQTYYVTALNRPPSDISWVGSMQVFLLFFIGTFTGRLTDAGYFRPVFILGSFLGVFGLFMTSLSTTYWQLFLSQGVCCGLGNGALFCPSLSLLSTYFSKKRSLAIGVAAAGSATGGMVFPAMVQQLLPKVGFAWTMRALGFIQLGCLGVCVAFMKPRIPPRKKGALVDWASFKEVPYVLFAVGMFFNFWGVYFAFYYLGSFARSIIDLPYTESINLLITLNGVGCLGRIVPNYLADRYFGPMNMLIPSVFLSSLLCFCWIGVTSRGGLYAWAVIYGIVGAAIQSLFPATLSSLTTNLSMAGTRMGMIFTIVSFAVLTGPPIAGQLIQLEGGRYKYAQIFAGADLMVGCGFLVAARVAQSRVLLKKM